MKKISFAIVFAVLLCFPSVVAASRWNEPGEDTAKYIHMGNFVLREVKADRSMGTWENEDRWKIWYHFDEEVTNVEFKWHAIDGTNDHDRRDYTDKKSERSKNKEYSLGHGNFPTYVDNMQIDVWYDYGGERHHYQFVIYTTGGSDKGSQPLEVKVVDLAGGKTAADTIPEENKDKDGNGALGDAPEDPIGAVKDMVMGPYNFLKWITDTNTMVMLVIGFMMIYISTMILIKFQSAGAEVGALITLLLGIMMLAGTILDGINAWGL